jgi:hypothetical protein
VCNRTDRTFSNILLEKSQIWKTAFKDWKNREQPQTEQNQVRGQAQLQGQQARGQAQVMEALLLQDWAP